MAMRGALDPSFEDRSMTGHFSMDLLETMHRRVGALVGVGTGVKKAYVGIASGPDARAAMRRRYDDYKFGEGISHMYALYATSSDDYCRKVEDDLVSFLARSDVSINRTGGGGGRRSGEDTFYVYLAVRKWGSA